MEVDFYNTDNYALFTRVLGANTGELRCQESLQFIGIHTCPYLMSHLIVFRLYDWPCKLFMEHCVLCLTRPILECQSMWQITAIAGPFDETCLLCFYPQIVASK